MASRWRLRLRMMEPQLRAPARAPAKPHTNTSWPAGQTHKHTTLSSPQRGHTETWELRGRPTCQVEVLQRSLGPHVGVQLGGEAGGVVLGAVNLPFGRADVVCVGDGGPRVHVLDLQRRNRKYCVKPPPSSRLQGDRRYLVSGDLGEDVHHHLQDGVDEGLLQLLVLGRSVGGFVVLPLLKPVVAGQADQAQGGLSWGRRE